MSVYLTKLLLSTIALKSNKNSSLDKKFMHRMLHMHSVDKSDDGCVQNPSKKVLALGFVHGERGKKNKKKSSTNPG